MPAEGVARCRAAWARLVGHQTCVVHGDPNPRNIRLTADRVAMIDWDESHVDVADLDLVLPHNAADLPRRHVLDLAAQASAAWIAAVCWDDDYAKARLAEVRAVSQRDIRATRPQKATIHRTWKEHPEPGGLRVLRNSMMSTN